MRHQKEYRLTVKKTSFESVIINKSKSAADVARNYYHEDINIYESFFILLIDAAGYTQGYAKISQGGVASTVVDMAFVTKFAVDSLAKSVILIHNHPSGSLRPSQQDKAITEKVKKALKLLDVKLVDHIILTEESFFSFADSCEL